MNQSEVKIISKKNDTFAVIHKVVNIMADLVKPTYGPASNKVIIDRFTHRIIVDDAVQSLRDFELPDPVENAIARIVKKVAITVSEKSKDGTCGSMIMLQAIINEVARKANFNGRKIEKELKKAISEVEKSLFSVSKPVKTKEELKKVALTAYDEDRIAEMIASTFIKLGKDATIKIEDSHSGETFMELINGIKIDSGYISPYMANNSERSEAEIKKPYILITDYRLTEHTDIQPIMQKMVAARVPINNGLVVICENLEQGALNFVIKNLPQIFNLETKTKGNFSSIAICIPKVENRTAFLEDLAILTGGKVFSASKGDKLEKAEVKDLGRAESITADEEKTIIVGPKGKKADIAMAINSLKTLLANKTKQKEKDEIEFRINMYNGSIAVIKAGAYTEDEQKTVKKKVENAVHSTKNAYQSGVVRGSGLSLANIKTSSKILNDALLYPARQLRENMGLDDDIEFKKDEALNVVTGEIGNFMKVGVLDPVKTLISEVKSAVSIASELITSTGMIVECPKEDK